MDTSPDRVITVKDTTVTRTKQFNVEKNGKKEAKHRIISVTMKDTRFVALNDTANDDTKRAVYASMHENMSG